MKNETKLLLPLWILVVFFSFAILYIWKSLITTILFTSILLFIFSGIYNFCNKKLWSHILSVCITVWIFISFFLSIGYIISSEIDNFWDDINKIGTWLTVLSERFDFIPSSVSEIDLLAISEKIDFASIGKNALGIISWIVGGLSTVAFLLVFLMLEKNMFAKKVKTILSHSEKKKVFKIYRRIYDDMNTFFLSKFSLALLNAVTSVIIMKVFWLEYALMFGLLVFLLDFIPAIWWIIALSLPFLYSFVQFDTYITPFILLVCLFIPQFISGNIIEPKIMWNRLNLSSFVILVALIFWSGMWWIVWAFLAVPLMASINIVLSQFHVTKPIAILLSKNGKV